MSNYRVVIADDDLDTIELIKLTLQMDDYTVIETFDGAAALAKVREEKPDMVLLDFDMPNMNGVEVCSAIKSDRNTRYIPVIILSGTNSKVHDKIIGLRAGADDYMVKPFDPDELRTRVGLCIHRTKEIISLNPLTKLPGSIGIEEEIIRRMESKKKFAVGYIDLDHFKAYNDYYGYKKGDNIINLLHAVIFEAVNLNGSQADYIGHIGGDDFIIVAGTDQIDAICKYITSNFDQRIPAHYSKEDREKGNISTTDRLGNKRDFPIMTVSIGISTNEQRDITHYGQLIDVLIDMKKYAKTLSVNKGSTYVKDRRTD